jgi:PAS domain S-box-containing protein
VFIPLILLGSSFVYFQVKKILQENIEKDLQDTIYALSNLIRTSTAISIKTQLHTIAEKNLSIVQYYYEQYLSGNLNKSQAISRIEEVLLSQPIGISGYIYCLNSKGIVEIHPNAKVKNTDVSGFEFVRRQLEIRNGYIEYDWKNPGEEKERPKALYMVYFEPLDWIISVSSYRDEFDRIVDIDDFKGNFLFRKTGDKGYAFVLAEDGTMLVHPDINGVKFDLQIMYPKEFIKQIVQQKNGKINYSWTNPGEIKPHEKQVIFKNLPEYKWIVASSSNVEDIFMPIHVFRNVLIFILVVIVLSSVGITYLISTSVTKPLVSLMKKLEEGIKGNFSVRMNEGKSDEFGRLARHFNSFMEQLEQSREQVKTEIRKNVEVQAALVENDLKLRSLFNQSFQFTGILSPSGILEEINQSILEFAGCTAEEVRYKPFWQAPWFRHDSMVQEQLKEAIKAAIEKNFVRFETTSISKQNEIKNIDISIKSIFNSSGEIAFIMTESRDITDYKLAARERKNMAVQLEKSQKMEAIGTLAGGIAHDFNNILSGILGYAQLAEMNLGSPGKARGHLTQIIKGAHRAAELTQQILTFSRRTEFEKQPLSLYLVLKEALKLLRSSIPSTIDITEVIESKSKILADPTQMHQVIMNLCTNAYHAMGEKVGILTVRLNEKFISGGRDVFDQEIKQGKYLELEVTDTGCGMNDEILKKAFDPYFTTKEIGKGTGFGLALVHAIVEEHGGHIKVQSQAGKGSSFYIHLPVAEDQNETRHMDMEKDKMFKGGTERIMVVDDEEDIRMILQEFLTSAGYKVSVFENGARAFKAFQKDPDQFDLVVTDMTMPHMTGEELARKILSVRDKCPVILCTGYSETITEIGAVEMGIRKYLSKPFSNQDLALAIREILDDPELKK